MPAMTSPVKATVRNLFTYPVLICVLLYAFPIKIRTHNMSQGLLPFIRVGKKDLK
jgi:hypothetical protein